jgi:hypothetical protein
MTYSDQRLAQAREGGGLRAAGLYPGHEWAEEPQAQSRDRVLAELVVGDGGGHGGDDGDGVGPRVGADWREYAGVDVSVNVDA